MNSEAGDLLKGSGDIHVHTSPSLVPARKSDIWELIEACAAKKMAFAVIKWHHGDSYSAADAVNKKHEEAFHLYGGLVLNRPVGGLNPYAVDCAISLKARIIWLPTLDAVGHEKAMGQLGGFPFQEVRRKRFPDKGISILTPDGELCDEMKEILSLINGSETVLGSGHISKEEIFVLKRYIESEKLDLHLLINHIDLSVPGLTIKDLKPLAGPNIWFELAYITVSALGKTPVQTIINFIKTHPDLPFVLASDSGQSSNPISPEAMERFVTLLLEHGLDAESIHPLLHRNLKSLLYR